MKNLKNTKEKGITLIALVVTIVVLIILATVSILALFGDNGIISRAKKAKEAYTNGKIQDDLAMDELLNNLNNYNTISSEHSNQDKEKDEEIASLKEKVASLEGEVKDLNNQVEDLNGQINDLNNQIEEDSKKFSISTTANSKTLKYVKGANWGGNGANLSSSYTFAEDGYYICTAGGSARSSSNSYNLGIAISTTATTIARIDNSTTYIALLVYAKKGDTISTSGTLWDYYNSNGVVYRVYELL